jgi:hypothetical protein
VNEIPGTVTEVFFFRVFWGLVFVEKKNYFDEDTDLLPGLGAKKWVVNEIAGTVSRLAKMTKKFFFFFSLRH